MRRIGIEQARRMALHAQGLATAPTRRRATAADVAALVRRIGALQLDPVAPVARSPLLVAHARLGNVDDAAIDAAAYRDKLVFDGWAHEASLIHIDDLPVVRCAQRTAYSGASPRAARIRAFLEANVAFADAIVDDLRERGPLRAKEIEDHSHEPWRHGFWTGEVSSRQTIARMLGFLWGSGRIGVGRREGIERVWDVFERCVPPGALDAAEGLDDDTARRLIVRRALRLLGVARAPHVRNHFLRFEVRDPAPILDAQDDVERVAVAGRKGIWYAFTDDLERDLAPGVRTVALSPFDNVLCDRARTAELFDFDHRLEIYVPKHKRRWGYYVLPILHGERFVARADLKLDKATGVLHALSLHYEPGRRPQRAVQGALERLAAWRGAIYPERA